jgi:hypothetical protein
MILQTTVTKGETMSNLSAVQGKMRLKPEQSSKALEACSLLRAYQEQPFINYKWEELVGKLCRMEDPGLRETGLRELKNINALQDHGTPVAGLL